MRAFGRYVPPQVVQGLLEGSVQRDLGMVEKTVAVAIPEVKRSQTPPSPRGGGPASPISS